MSCDNKMFSYINVLYSFDQLTQTSDGMNLIALYNTLEQYLKLTQNEEPLKLDQTHDHRLRLPTDLETFFKLSFLVLYSKKTSFKNKTD